MEVENLKKKAMLPLKYICKNKAFMENETRAAVHQAPIYTGIQKIIMYVFNIIYSIYNEQFPS
jgi:p-aminobenzoyl-glutamate transporter AbgT